MPKQDCLNRIALYNTDTYKLGKDSVKDFKTRDDALDYCMAWSWYFY
jgi:hypothetical protein